MKKNNNNYIYFNENIDEIHINLSIIYYNKTRITFNNSLKKLYFDRTFTIYSGYGKYKHNLSRLLKYLPNKLNVLQIQNECKYNYLTSSINILYLNIICKKIIVPNSIKIIIIPINKIICFKYVKLYRNIICDAKFNTLCRNKTLYKIDENNNSVKQNEENFAFCKYFGKEYYDKLKQTHVNIKYPSQFTLKLSMKNKNSLRYPTLYRNAYDINISTYATYIECPIYFNQSLCNLSSIVKIILFSHFYNCPIENLPSSVIVIKTGNNFNKHVDDLPINLESLEFGCNFNRNINKLPINLKFISLGNNFNKHIYQLPKSLEFIKIKPQHYYSENTFKIKMNNYCKKLKNNNLLKKIYLS
jgi:hypothetical protein